MQTPPPTPETWMRRALDLAILGRGQVSPNPLVGCVVVHQNQVIGEGYHQQYGRAHAEVNAINSVPERWRPLLPQATLYVNLEPCSHYGKTPPCADFIIRHQIKKVVVANLDTNPLVAGKGIQKLRNAGVEVETGVLQAEGRNLNKRFFTFMNRLRPYLVLKWAETVDGFVARPDGTSKWISNGLSRKLVHKWRAEEDAVMVGTQTAALDNPRLNVRDWPGRDPVRIVLDKNLRLPSHLHLFDGSQPTLCYNAQQESYGNNLELVKLKDGNFLQLMVDNLYARRIQSVMVEGGAVLLQGLLELDLWDELRVFRSPGSFGQGQPAPRVRGQLIYKEQVLDDDLLIFRREDAY
jgi:diaminohydroxyphosphoribosylaminopyrimidine deaminase / 5-amino-6-(5-phosphoribosylamino)uracil reductase